MGKLLSNAVTWIIVLMLAILGMLAGIAFGWFETDDGPPAPGPSASPSDGVSPTPTVEPGFVSRSVTTGEFVPSAEALTESVLVSAGSGWVVAINDTSQVNTAVDPHTVTPDQKILYLISPDGTRYELANLDAVGLSQPNLVAWDDDRDLLLLEQDRTTLNVLDMATGEVAFSWTFCPSSEGYARYGEARDGNWLVRGGCQGDGIDGIYADDGTPVPSNIVGAAPYLTVYDIGEVQVQYEFEGMVDEKYIAFYPDGSSAPLPWDEGGDCWPLEKGRGMTLAMNCYSYSDEARQSVWELPVDGSSPYEVVSSDQLEDFAASNGGFSPSEYTVTDYCSDSALGIVQFRFTDETVRLGVLYGGTVEAVGETPFRFRVCHAAEGTASLVSGDGHLWWIDFDSGTNILMLPGMSAGSSIQVVGSDGYTALRLP